jgi:hypothetical protein
MVALYPTKISFPVFNLLCSTSLIPEEQLHAIGSFLHFRERLYYVICNIMMTMEWTSRYYFNVIVFAGAMEKFVFWIE